MRSFAETRWSEVPRTAFAPLFEDYVEDVVLAADTLVRVPVPTGARYVLFSFDGDVRAKPGTLATDLVLRTAAGASADGSGGVLNPSQRRIPDDATHICLRAPAACKGSLSFYG